MSRLFGGVYYNEKSQPTLRLGDDDIQLLQKAGTLAFDTSQRYCVGWHDLATGTSHTCPDNATTDAKYDTCPACQRRTGFNPAFYNATSVSKQQEVRNAQPHILYLAYMGDNYIKVGISWAERGNRRLLDQGARSALILETFPTALIARQYEASIATLPNIHETTPTRTKLQLLAHPHDNSTAEQALNEARTVIEQTLKTTFQGSDIIHLDTHYYANNSPVSNFTTLTEPLISGQTTAIIGDIMFMQHDDRTVALPLRRFTGYKASFDTSITPLDLPAEQVSLFG